MAEKGGRKILAIVTICIILVSIGFSGCFGDEKKEDINGKFKLGFKNHNDNNLIVHIKIKNSVNNTVFSDNLSISSGNYEVIEINLNLDKYNFTLSTNNNVSSEFKLEITKKTPNKVYMIVLEDDNVEIAGYPKN